MTSAVSSAGPLIHLAQAGCLDLLMTLFEKVVIPPAVYHEAIEAGLEQGHPDAVILDQEMKHDRICVDSAVDMSKLQVSSDKLHKGELEAIALALTRRPDAVLLDDEEARVLARALGLTVMGTLGVLVENVSRRKVTRDKAKTILDSLNDVMYLSSDVYALARKRVDEITD